MTGLVPAIHLPANSTRKMSMPAQAKFAQPA